MSEWKECKLGDVITLNYGKALREQDRIFGDIPVYSSAGLTGYHNQALVNSAGLIIGRKGTIGKIHKTKTPFYCIDTAYYLLPDDDKYDLDFIYYMLQTMGLEDLNEDSAVPGLNRNTTYSQNILLPPLPEQKAIASVLSSLDDKIDLLHRQNKTLEAMAEALFRQWFIEEADEKWEEGKLGDLISIKHGYAFKGSEISEIETSNILVTPGNFKIGGGFKADKFKYFSGKSNPENYVFNPGDLIVTMTDLSVDTDTLGYPALIPCKQGIIFLHNQRIGKVIFKNDNLLKYFIYLIMKTEEYRAHIIGGASGTSIMHTSPERITSYELKIPDKSVILKFNNIVMSLFEKIDFNNYQLNSLKKLRDTLLPKLMSGEVRVKT